MASCLTRQMTTARPCRFLLRIVCRGLMRFNLLDALAVLQLRGCQCAETPQILQLFPTQTKKKTGKRKKAKTWQTLKRREPKSVSHACPIAQRLVSISQVLASHTLAWPTRTRRKPSIARCTALDGEHDAFGGARWQWWRR